MDTHDPSKHDKQITIAVPEDRVPEFYAFYGRFLAAERYGRRGHRGPRGHGRCHPHEEERSEESRPAAKAPAA